MPISPQIQELERRLLALSRTKQLAFAAACAERLVTVHDFDGYANSDDLERASELIWKAALGGKASAASIKKLRKGVTEAMPESAEDEPTYSATTLSAVAVLNALQLVEGSDPQAVVLVSRGEYDAYEVLGEDAAREYEQDWQRQAIGLLESTDESAIKRESFEALPPPPEDLFPELVD